MKEFCPIALAALLISCGNGRRPYSERQMDEEVIAEQELIELTPIENVTDSVKCTTGQDAEIHIIEDSEPDVEMTPVAEESVSAAPSDSDMGTENVAIETQSRAQSGSEKIYDAVEQMPTFPGGDAEMMKYLANHITYPTQAAENGIQGTVMIQFIVMKDGSIGEIKVVRGRDSDLDREAIRVVRSLPNFIPGRMNGEPVNVWFTLPIHFRLN